eukprot:gene12732-22461_t
MPAVPVLFWASTPVLPGEVALIGGAGFGRGAARRVAAVAQRAADAARAGDMA